MVDRDLTRDLGDVSVEGSSDIVIIAEDKCLFEVEPDRNDVACVLESKFVGLLGLQLMFEQEFLVVWKGCDISEAERGHSMMEHACELHD